jgi:hypothetical protein
MGRPKIQCSRAYQQNPNDRPFQQHLWNTWSLTRGRGRSGCKNPVSATLAGAQICDYNILSKHLAVTVHQYLTNIYFTVKSLITEHRNIQLDLVYSSTKNIHIG